MVFSQALGCTLSVQCRNVCQEEQNPKFNDHNMLVWLSKSLVEFDLKFGKQSLLGFLMSLSFFPQMMFKSLIIQDVIRLFIVSRSTLF